MLAAIKSRVSGTEPRRDMVAETRGRSGHPLAGRAIVWLNLAATPTFAVMALLTEIYGGGQADILCSAALDGVPLSGMTVMYLLMSVFHSSPWLKLISRRVNRPKESGF